MGGAYYLRSSARVLHNVAAESTVTLIVWAACSVKEQCGCGAGRTHTDHTCHSMQQGIWRWFTQLTFFVFISLPMTHLLSLCLTSVWNVSTAYVEFCS